MTGDQKLVFAGIIATFLSGVLGVWVTTYTARKSRENEQRARRDEELRQWRDRAIPTIQAARRAASDLFLSHTVYKKLEMPTEAQAEGSFPEFAEASDGLEQLELGHPSEDVRHSALRCRHLLGDNSTDLQLMLLLGVVFLEDDEVDKDEVQKMGERANHANRRLRLELERLAHLINRVREEAG